MSEEKSLLKHHCVPCEGGVRPLPAEEVERLLKELNPGWILELAEGHSQVVKNFRFPDFKAAVGFVNRITAVAEAEGHHPELLVGWGKVQVRLWTHAAGGLTENDFVLAAQLDQLSPQ